MPRPTTRLPTRPQRSLRPAPSAPPVPLTPIAALAPLTALIGLLLFSGAGVARSQTSLAHPTVGLPPVAYYGVTGIDPRLCPSPACGGVYVSLVNRGRTRCADGAFAEQCYAPILDWSALALSPEEVGKLEGAFRDGGALVRGELRMQDSPFGPLPGLVVQDAWLAVAGEAPTQTFFGVVPSGIVCFTYPCPSYRAQILNKHGRRMVHDLDLAASGATPEQIDQGYAALYDGGLLVAGRRELFRGPAGQGVRLVAEAFYTKVEPGAGGAPR